MNTHSLFYKAAAQVYEKRKLREDNPIAVGNL